MKIYRPILKDAWSIAWRYRFLWFFGIFASFLGSIGGLGIIFDRVSGLTGGEEFLPVWKSLLLPFSSPRLFYNLKTVAVSDPLGFLLMLTIFGVLILLGLLVIWLAVKSQIAIVALVKKIDDRQKVSFNDGLAAGRRYFWPVLLLNAFISLAAPVFLFIFGPISSQLLISNEPSRAIFYVLIFTVFFLLNLIIYFIGLYAINYKVLKSKSIWESVVEAVNLFGRNWLVSLEMAIILTVVNLAGLLAIILVSLILAVPFSLLIYIFGFLGMQGAIYLLLGLALAFLLLLIVFVGAWLTTFQLTSWTLLFLRLTEGGAVSKLIRLVYRK